LTSHHGGTGSLIRKFTGDLWWAKRQCDRFYGAHHLFPQFPSHQCCICMFIQKHFPYSVINVEKFCKDKELEACALKLDFLSTEMCIITVYRSPNDNFQYFIKSLDNIIKKMYKPDVQFVVI
jgi:hypothetical protein